MTRLVDAKQLAEQTGLPYKVIAHLAADSPAPFTSVRMSKRTLMIDIDQFKIYLTERTRLTGEL